MEETKKEPTHEETLQYKYDRLCAKAGHIQCNIALLTGDLSVVTEQLKDLHTEARMANDKAAKEAAAKAKLAAVPTGATDGT